MSRIAATALCLACAALVPRAAGAELQRVEIDPDRSYVAARTGRAGVLGFLGHEHGVLATRWSASLCVDPQRPSSLRGTIRVPVEALRIDTPAALEVVGLEESVDAEQRQELQEKLTGPRYLDAEGHGEIRFRAASFELDDDTAGRIRGDLTIRGVTRPIEVPVEISGLRSSRPVVKGRFEVLQTHHGMTPESVAGVVNVADAVDVGFRLAGLLTASPCDGASP